MFILEHVYRWLSGAEASLASPTVFYPFPGVLFFSDIHAGSALIYAFFRALGQSEYLAYDEWFLVGYLSTFLAAFYALARFGSGPLMAALGAAIFAFSLPSVAQIGHAQLVYRCGIPLALLYLWQGLRDSSPRNLVLMFIWLCIQLLMSIYLGMFLIIMLAVFAIAAPLLENASPSLRDHLFAAFGWLRRWPKSNPFVFNSDAVYAIFLFLLFVGTLAMFINYAHVSREYGFHRKWIEIATMIPRPISYFLMSDLPYWSPVSQVLAAKVPTAHEHNLFVGFGALGFAVVGLLTILRNAKVVLGSAPASAVAVTLLVVVLITSTTDHGLTLYRPLASLPGLNAIRAVSRIGLALTFPIGMIAAFGLRALVVESRSKILGSVFATLLACLAGYEFVTMSRYTTPIETSEQRVDAMIAAARVRAQGIASPILLAVNPGDDGFAVQLDAMLAAQRLGWPTINGYSGNDPPGVAAYPSCAVAARQFAQYELWRETHHARDHGGGADSLIKRVVFVGADCDSEPLNRLVVPAPRRTETPSETMPADVVIVPGNIMREGSTVVFDVEIQNHNAENWIPGRSSFPISLSWRFVPAVGDENGDDDGWDPREALPSDVAPAGSIRMAAVAAAPTKPGNYRLEVSMVADGLFWFHDIGMRPAQFNQIVTVP